MRCAAPVQGQAAALVLHQHAGIAMREPHRLLVQGMQPLAGIGRGIAALRALLMVAQLVAVQAGRGQAQGGEEFVQLRQGAPADQCDRAIQPVADAPDRFTHIGQQRDRLGVVREFDKGAIHVQEQRTGIVQQRRRRTLGEVVDHSGQHASVDVITRLMMTTSTP
ncbi:hypothetical protein D3C71_1570840 [compost metagenome]